MSKQNDFNQFGLSKELIQSLTLLHYTTPTPIQAKAIPYILQGKNILAKSQTGTGKTAAFGIPICEKITWDEFLPQALILEPTRELAYQVKEELFQIGRMKRLKVPVLLGGLPIDKQKTTLKQRNHILVGTPGRIMDHVRKGNIDFSNIKYLVIDEADLMLQMGFIDEVEDILQHLPANRVSMLFSATMDESIRPYANKWILDPISVFMEQKTETVSLIKQEVYHVPSEEKYDIFLSCFMKENPKNAMIFCATKEMVNTLYHKMKRAQIRCGMLHGDMEQRERLQTVDDFREGRFFYLICTDIAARGVDFESVTHVFHYDFPNGNETYVHRTGRTGRNGKDGISISFVTGSERRTFEHVVTFIKDDILEMPLDSVANIDKAPFLKRQKEKFVRKEQKGDIFQSSITKLAIGGGKKSKLRAVDIVGTICSIDSITAEDIGVIDVRESITYVEILNQKGPLVFDILQTKPIKGKLRKIQTRK